jgi:hypothetical protein
MKIGEKIALLQEEVKFKDEKQEVQVSPMSQANMASQPSQEDVADAV